MSQQTTFSDLYSDLTLNPRSWLSLESQTRYDIQDGDWRMSITTLTLRPGKSWSWTLGQVYLRDDFSCFADRAGPRRERVHQLIPVRLNENWGLRDGPLFRCQHGNLCGTGLCDRSRPAKLDRGADFPGPQRIPARPQDFTVALSLWLKAYPKSGHGPEAMQFQ